MHNYTWLIADSILYQVLKMGRIEPSLKYIGVSIRGSPLD